MVKTNKLFLASQERKVKVEQYEIEIILQKSKLMLKKKGNYRAETETANDVFTLLEHPMTKKVTVENLDKKESLYEGRVRADLVKSITVILPESGKSQLRYIF